MRISEEQYHYLRSEYGLSPYNIENLERLADFLESDAIPPPQFDIRYYVDNDDIDLEDWREEHHIVGHPQLVPALVEQNVCGTTACAVGHAPLIPGMAPSVGESWGAYELRLFGVTQTGPGSSPWEFMFGPSWRGANNTAKGTAARIRFFLTHTRFDWKDYWTYTHNDNAPWLVVSEAELADE